MSTIILLALLLVSLAACASSFLAYRTIKRQFLNFVLPEGENQPSPLAKTLELFADMIARSLVAQAKTYLMQMKSAEVRAEAGEMERANPLSSMLPRTLRRSPLASLATQFLMQKLAGSNGSNHSISAGASESPKFKL